MAKKKSNSKKPIHKKDLKKVQGGVVGSSVEEPWWQRYHAEPAPFSGGSTAESTGISRQGAESTETGRRI